VKSLWCRMSVLRKNISGGRLLELMSCADVHYSTYRFYVSVSFQKLPLAKGMADGSGLRWIM
jgi:hypothetical protein